MFKKYRNTIAGTLLAGLIAGGTIAPSNALADATPTVLGKTIGEWSEKWWQWAYSIPTPSNPMLDTSGAYCDVGQRGPMWFLAGYFIGDGTPVVRDCTVPRGKYILFPIANATWIQTRQDQEVNPQYTETDYRRLANEFLPPSVGGDIEASLDGNPIIFNPKTPIIQSQSPVFAAPAPPPAPAPGQAAQAGRRRAGGPPAGFQRLVSDVFLNRADSYRAEAVI